MSLYLTPFITAYTLTLTALVGLVMGSFLNCAAIRLTTGESIVRGRSHCPACGHRLSARDLVPVASWLLLKGKCRYCGAKVSPRYLISELFTALIFVLTVIRYDISLQALEMLIFDSILLCIAFADLEAYLIPDRLIIAGIAVRALYILASGDIGALALQSLIGGLCVSLPVFILVLVMEKLMKKEAMGGGDIKLLFMCGIYFSWTLNIVALLAACIIGIMIGLATLRRRAAGYKLIPFGPAIACGAWFAMLFGTRIVTGYASLFGL